MIKKSFVTARQRLVKYIYLCKGLSNSNSYVPIKHPFTNWELACPRQEAEVFSQLSFRRPGFLRS